LKTKFTLRQIYHRNAPRTECGPQSEVCATVEEMAHYPVRPSRSSSTGSDPMRVQQKAKSGTSPFARTLDRSVSGNGDRRVRLMP
jgi:hypothetical protein